jgi:predicted DNA-binding protein
MPIMGVRVPKEALKALDIVSRATERSRSYIVRKALNIFIEEYVDYQVALNRLSEKENHILSSKEMRKELGL